LRYIAYGRGGVKAHGVSAEALVNLTRLYWYTVEFGLIRQKGELRIYGSGIVSSKGESIHCLESAAPNRIGFDIKRIMRTRYRIDTFQKTYFVIDSFEQLMEATRPDFVPIYAEPTPERSRHSMHRAPRRGVPRGQRVSFLIDLGAGRGTAGWFPALRCERRAHLAGTAAGGRSGLEQIAPAVDNVLAMQIDRLLRYIDTGSADEAPAAEAAGSVEPPSRRAARAELIEEWSRQAAATRAAKGNEKPRSDKPAKPPKP
jgi:hypothetical protein